MKTKLERIGDVVFFSICFLILASMLLAVMEKRLRKKNSTAEKLIEQILSLCLIAPILEELIFRGPLFLAFSRLNKTSWVFISISAVAFGILHLFWVKQFIRFLNLSIEVTIKKFRVRRALYTTAFGFLLGVIVIRYQSLYLTIAIHCINNLIACLPIKKIQVKENEPSSE